jgi:hypothetical protein
MKLSPEAEEFLTRYFYAVKMELPGKQRDDIVKELQSNLLDSMEEQYSSETLIDKTLIKKILLENGSPRSIAEKFIGPRYLIGPKLYPLFAQVLSIVLTVLGSVLMVAFLIGAFMNTWPNDAILGNVFSFIGSLWNALLASAAIIVLVFAVLERRLPEKTDEFENNAWKPDDLPEITHTKNVRYGKHIFGIAGGIVLIMGMIYLMNVGNIYAWVNGQKVLTGTITDSFKALLPFFITLSGLEMANHIVILSQQTYSAFSRWFHIVLDGLNVVLLGFIFGALPLFTFTWQSYPEEFRGQFQILEPMIQKSMTGVIALVFFVTLASLVQQVYTEITKPSNYKY